MAVTMQLRLPSAMIDLRCPSFLVDVEISCALFVIQKAARD